MRTIEEVVDEIARYNSMDALAREYVKGHIEKALTEILEIHKTEQEKWIPCSEMLPEEYGEVLITWTTSQSKREFIGIAEYGFKGEWLLEDYIKNYRDVEVIAWMPIEPYEPESEVNADEIDN